MRICGTSTYSSDSRQGVVLPLVLVIILILSYSVFSFCQLMVSEYTATSAGLQLLQRRELAGSGIEIAASVIRNQHLTRSGFPAVNSSYSVSTGAGGTGTILLLRAPSAAVGPHVGKLGLSDESSKLNLNSLPLESSRRKESRTRLMALPGMSLQTADAILDWLDTDDEPSEFGAETSYYTAQNPPRMPRQGPVQSLHELLQIRGVTPEGLFGDRAEANHKPNQGFLPSEVNAGIALAAFGGWSQYLTVTSCESVLNESGRRKININQPVLALLYDQLLPILGADAARYIVAWRMRGATYLDQQRPDAGEDQEQRRLERLETARLRLAAQLGQSPDNTHSIHPDFSRRGGLTLGDGAMKFRSLLDLFGGQIQISVDARDRLLQSPWPADPVTLRRMLPVLERVLTITEHSVLQGRINVNEAAEPVLRSIPGISESIARGIVRVQPEIPQSRTGEFDSVAWLVTRGFLSVSELRRMGELICTGGDVRTGVSVGFISGQSAATALRYTLDCSGPTRKILQLTDLPAVPGEVIAGLLAGPRQTSTGTRQMLQN